MKELIKYSPGIWLVICGLAFFISCQKIDWLDHYAKKDHGHLKQTKDYSSEVVVKWLDLQWRVFPTPQEEDTELGFLPPRFYAYCGIALYESLVSGMPAYQSLSRQLVNMPVMSQTQPGMAYHWPTSANTALAFMTRNFLPNISGFLRGHQ